MLRTSSYTIYVDLPGNREEMLLVHGRAEQVTDDPVTPDTAHALLRRVNCPNQRGEAQRGAAA